MLKIDDDWVVEARMGVLSVFAEPSYRGWGTATMPALAG